MKNPVQYIVFSLVLVAFFLLLVTKASAQTPNNLDSKLPNYPISQSSTNPDVPNNLHYYTQNVLIEVMSAVVCQLAGVDPVNPSKECLGVDRQTGKIGFVKNGGGAIGVMTNMITMLYTPPLHTGDYFQYLAQNFGFAKNTYAINSGGISINQGTTTTSSTGIGFRGLFPLLPLWSTFRNIVYMLFVLVFVIIGIAIMLRVRIDPRTIMTIQNQIPKIIVGIILITFSFAIAGFLIDMMYTSIYLLGNTIVSTDPEIANSDVVKQAASSTNPFSAADNILKKNAFIYDKIEEVPGSGILILIAESSNTVSQFAYALFRPIVNTMFPIKIEESNKSGCAWYNAVCKVKDVIKNPLKLINFINPVSGVSDVISLVSKGGGFLFDLGSNLPGPVGGLFGVGSNVADFFKDPIQAISSVLAFLLGRIVGALAFLVIGIAVLWALFRLWFALISAYIMILIDVVFAPFWIIAGLFPGSQINFSAWIRDLVANLASFVAAIVMFLLGRVFIDAFGASSVSGQFVPPLTANPLDTRAIGAFIGLGIILMTPNVVNMMKTALKTPKLDLSTVGQAVGVGAGAPSRIVGGGMSTAFAPHYQTPPGGGPPQLVYPGGTLGRFLRGFGVVR